MEHRYMDERPTFDPFKNALNLSKHFVSTSSEVSTPHLPSERIGEAIMAKFDFVLLAVSDKRAI